ncbi:MAG: hypothetical protein RLZZ308_5 [Candidatus Parcubacteria bacterium]
MREAFDTDYVIDKVTTITTYCLSVRSRPILYETKRKVKERFNYYVTILQYPLKLEQ